mgnify:FL=1
MLFRSLLTITEDTARALDLLYPACCRWALRERFNVDGDGCLEHLAEALAPWQIEPRAIPDPLNLFFAVAVGEGGALTLSPPPSRPGDAVALCAEMDVLLAVSTCAVPRPGREASGYTVEIYR